MSVVLGTGEHRYRVVENWAKLPDGWEFRDVAAVACDSKDRVYVFNRSEHPMMVFDKDGNSVRVEHGYFERSNTEHLSNFIDCIRSREKPRADIEFGHRSTLLSHYGNIAYRTGRKLSIDPATEGFVNDDEANGYVKRQYRDPWVVPEEV